MADLIKPIQDSGPYGSRLDMFTFANLIGNENQNRALSRLGQGGFAVESIPIILVVEDDPLIQSVVEETLTDGGFEIVIVSSGENAIDLLDIQKVRYRAVVTDINLGRDKMDGWDIARHAREIDAEFPVVYMTGAGADDWASKGVPNSILLTKPFAPARLLTAVSQLLNGGSSTREGRSPRTARPNTDQSK
jgi:DNA-binding response OmpR family regulator